MHTFIDNKNNKRNTEIEVFAIRIDPKKVAVILGFIVITFTFVNIAIQTAKFVYSHPFIYGLAPFFDLDKEANMPTYFSSILLLFSAFLLGIIAALIKKENKPYAYHWALLSIVFVYLSIDEAVCIHELWIQPMQTIFAAKGVFHFAWIIPGSAAILVLAALFCKFLFHLLPKSRLLFMIAAMFYLGGALGCEMIGGWFVSQFSMETFAYNMIATIEETFEMIGIVIFIYALLEYMQDHLKEIRLQIK